MGKPSPLAMRLAKALLFRPAEEIVERGHTQVLSAACAGFWDYRAVCAVFGEQIAYAIKQAMLINLIHL